MKKEEIKKVLVKAKEMYLNGESRGMCYSIEKALMWLGYGIEKKDGGLHYLQELIPEFNPKFLQAPRCSSYWWRISDMSSRLAAFDTLIEIYS